jgi:tellurite resistance protein TerC
MALQRNEELQPEHNPVFKLFRRVMPITERFEGDKFFIRRGGTLMATPLFLTLLIVESTDLVFAVDSIPAIFAMTQDPFIVYTSNVFAILGLRALYFLLANIIEKFQYLKLGLSFVLAVIGIKIMLSDVYLIPVQVSLFVVASILTISVVISLWKARTSAGKLKMTE